MIVERQSIIDAPAEQVWARVMATPEGINDELRPWMTMSMLRGAKDLTVDTVPVGTPIGRCWMRLFGVLPFDYDNLCITELQPLGFREDSTMLMVRQWRHERSVVPVDSAKSSVHDRLHSNCAHRLDRSRRFMRPWRGRCSGTDTDGYSGTSLRTNSNHSPATREPPSEA